MNNRIEFIGHIYKDSIASMDNIVKFFDHTIAAYEVIGDTDVSSMCGYPDNIGSLLKIKIVSPDITKLQYLENVINTGLHNHTSVYGKSFNISIATEGNCAILSVRENTL